MQQREQPHVQNLNLQRPDSDFIRPDNRNGFVQPAPPVYNEPSSPIYAQNQPQVSVNWAPQHNQINQMPQQYQQYDGKCSVSCWNVVILTNLINSCFIVE